MQVQWYPSPNFDERGDQEIRLLVVHYTGMLSARAAIERLCDAESRVSAHYTVDEDGTAYQHVSDSKRAWHAGHSTWQGRSDINDCSLGIELVNPGHQWGYRKFPRPQMAAFRELATHLLASYPIAPDAVVGHSDIAWWRKQDPGELFNWQEMACCGIGVWPSHEGGHANKDSTRDLRCRAPTRTPGCGSPSVCEIAHLLCRYGYHLRTKDDWYLALKAFQCHFHPEQVSGKPHPETIRRLRSLIRISGR